MKFIQQWKYVRTEKKTVDGDDDDDDDDVYDKWLGCACDFRMIIQQSMDGFVVVATLTHAYITNNDDGMEPMAAADMCVCVYAERFTTHAGQWLQLRKSGLCNWRVPIYRVYLCSKIYLQRNTMQHDPKF